MRISTYTNDTALRTHFSEHIVSRSLLYISFDVYRFVWVSLYVYRHPYKYAKTQQITAGDRSQGSAARAGNNWAESRAAISPVEMSIVSSVGARRQIYLCVLYSIDAWRQICSSEAVSPVHTPR